jgi:hypothetical protein
MSAIITSADGEYVFVALEDDSGNPLVIRATRPEDAGDAPTLAQAYAPGDGSAINVTQVQADADRMIFYGNFGTDVGIINHTISTVTNEDISPSSLGSEIVNCLVVNPSDSDEMICTIDTTQDLLYTSDGGANWAALNASALGFAPTALTVIWGGGGEPNRIFVAGNDTSDEILFFSPNDGAELADVAGASLGAVANIAGIEAGYVA